jgi:hypothetical protein
MTFSTTLGLSNVSCINEWVIPSVWVLANCTRMSALVFWFLWTWAASNDSSSLILSFITTDISIRNGSLVLASPLTHVTTSWEFVCSFRFFTPISNSRLSPAVHASYSAWLFIVENKNLSEILITRPSSLSRIGELHWLSWLRSYCKNMFCISLWP